MVTGKAVQVGFFLPRDPKPLKATLKIDEEGYTQQHYRDNSRYGHQLG